MAVKWYPERAKYGNVKTTVDGITFDSKKEADYYCELKMLRMGRVVRDFKCQVHFELQPAFKYDDTAIRAITYVADFVVDYEDGHTEVVDVKGLRTKEYLLKRKLLLYKYPDINFREI